MIKNVYIFLVCIAVILKIRILSSYHRQGDEQYRPCPGELNNTLMKSIAFIQGPPCDQGSGALYLIGSTFPFNGE